MHPFCGIWAKNELGLSDSTWTRIPGALPPWIRTVLGICACAQWSTTGLRVSALWGLDGQSVSSLAREAALVQRLLQHHIGLYSDFGILVFWATFSSPHTLKPSTPKPYGEVKPNVVQIHGGILLVWVQKVTRSMCLGPALQAKVWWARVWVWWRGAWVAHLGWCTPSLLSVSSLALPFLHNSSSTKRMNLVFDAAESWWALSKGWGGHKHSMCGR